MAPWLLALVLVACAGGDDDALDQARRRIERGDLETATAVLSGLEGVRADELRAQIASTTAHRAELERALKTIRADASAHTAGWSQQEFAKLLLVEHDPQSVELIARAQTELAAALRSAKRAEKHAPVAPTRSSASPALLEARSAQSQRQWKAALAHTADAVQQGVGSAEADALRNAVLSAALVEAEDLLVSAEEVERASGAEAAAQLLASEVDRFPSGLDFDPLRERLELLEDRTPHAAAASRPAASSRRPRVRVPSSTNPDALLARAESADECMAIAQSRASMGELGPAREAWLEAARRKPNAALLAECERSARECDARLALRQELSDFAAVDGPTAALLDRRTGSAQSAAPKFETIPLAELSLAVGRAGVSSKAKLGFVIESIVRGDESERALALEQLGACVERKQIDAEAASSLVARAKAQVGEAGWVFQGGRWIEGSQAKSEALALLQNERATKNGQLVGRFRRGSTVEREALFNQIRETGDSDLIAAALKSRWQDEWEALERNPNLRQLGLLAEARRALDSARAKALDLIFDEERYFYPYNPPECPPEKAAKYAAVQRDVDELVSAVRKIWEDSKPVKISEGLRQQLAALQWTTARAEEVPVALTGLPSQWRFALCLPADDKLSLAEFAWDPGERSALVESDRIEARNERLWAALGHVKPAADVPNVDEQRQVQITNEYRRMLGRRALAWNPKIEAAAQGHSDHMANSGEFSHFEQGDPARRTPFDRLKLAGYERGVSENISMGRSDPKSAHEGWTHSSGHHRNLLMRDHREMASAIASEYWTQNFGVDTAFLSEL